MKEEAKERRQQIVDLWNTGKYSMSQIGKIIGGISKQRIHQLLLEAIQLGIEVIPAEEFERKRIEQIEFAHQCYLMSNKWEILKCHHNHPYIRRKQLKRVGRWIKCEKCGYKENLDILEVHHIDENRINNSFENLLILCPNCHRLLHLFQRHFKSKQRGKNFKDNKMRIKSHFKKYSKEV